MNSKDIIARGLKDLNSRRWGYRKLQRYYDGDHDLAFATDKFKNAFGALFSTFSDNLMPAVVNGFADNLRVENFTVEEGDTEESNSAWRIWQENFMEQRSAELHRELIKYGDAYVIVWQDPLGRPAIYPNRAGQCTVGYDDDLTGHIHWAIKTWQTESRTRRVNLYLPDRVEKYEAPGENLGGQLNPNRLRLFETVDNPYGVVPFFHFAINCDIGEFGNSELQNVLPLNDALNKCLCDMLVAMEFGAFRQRWATGIEPHFDSLGAPISPFTSGASGLWTTESETARFGDFEVTNIEQYIKVQESIRAEIARVSSLPLHYLLLQSGNLASGRALQTAERRFQGKLQNLQTVVGARWAQVLRFALALNGYSEAAGAEIPIRLFTQWQDTSTLSELEKLQTLQAKKALGVSTKQLLAEAGYGAEDIRRITEESVAENNPLLT
jgi:Phage portal protein, SPP1 Gp6-like